uniref:Uncharacterized protein n=1 Tax=Steinernema glaseri TaxID=37863 RepID=A0A1I7YD38_9BILA
MQALECFDRRVWRHREEKEGEGFLSEESARKTERRAPIGSTSSLPAVRVKKDHWGQMAAGSARPIAEASRRHRLGAASCSPPQNKCPENTTTNVYGEEGETGRSQGGIIEKALFYDFALRVGATSVYDVAPSKVVVSLKRDTSPARGSASCYQSREHESHELPDRAWACLRLFDRSVRILRAQIQSTSPFPSPMTQVDVAARRSVSWPFAGESEASEAPMTSVAGMETKMDSDKLISVPLCAILGRFLLLGRFKNEINPCSVGYIKRNQGKDRTARNGQPMPVDFTK